MLFVSKEGGARWKKRTRWSTSEILIWCASTTKPMRRLKAEPGGERSREPAGETASWKSERRLTTNGYSLSHGSSGSMIWVFPFGIWPRIFDKRAPVLSQRRTREQWEREARRTSRDLVSGPHVTASFSIPIRTRDLVHVRNAHRRLGSENCRCSSISNQSSHFS